MQAFADALISAEKHIVIPEEDDFWAKLIGEWSFTFAYVQEPDENTGLTGEWIFSRVLNGTAIQDVFIFPSREERVEHDVPNGEYGSTLRIYDANKRVWNCFYGCNYGVGQFEARRENGEIVLTEIAEQKLHWIFSDITDDSFHWRSVEMQDGKVTKVYSKLFAVRKKE